MYWASVKGISILSATFIYVLTESEDSNTVTAFGNNSHADIYFFFFKRTNSLNKLKSNWSGL